jgi:tRNA(Ile)-lysidine synthase
MLDARCVPRPLFAAAIVPPDFSTGTPALVGISGGRDSVALLHWLHDRGHRRLIACHLDHGLRAESREDARFVARFARELGCLCVVSRANVGALAKRRKLSVETAARAARLEFFERCARKHGTTRVFLAHHADDQVETFLFNLLRGAGTGGLAGMASVTTIGGLTMARPLLGVWREEIDAYCERHQLPWREDASNASRAHTRNRLRHDALPALSAAMGRDVRQALWRAAELLRAEDEVLSLAPEDVQALEGKLEVESVRVLPLALQRRVIHAWLQREKIADVGFVEVEGVRSLLAGDVAKVNLPGKRYARRRAGRIFCE